MYLQNIQMHHSRSYSSELEHSSSNGVYNQSLQYSFLNSTYMYWVIVFPFWRQNLLICLMKVFTAQIHPIQKKNTLNKQLMPLGYVHLTISSLLRQNMS